MLDRNGLKPLYLQVKEKLQQEIENEVYSKDHKIPSERELCEMFNVSRITIRQALEEAIKDGLIYRQHGRGTFVADNREKFSQTLDQVHRFGDLLRSKGRKGKTKILTNEIVLADMHSSSILKVDVGMPLRNLHLLAYSEGKPVAFYESLILEDQGKEMAEKALELSNNNLPFTSVDLYQKDEGIKPSLIRQSIEATIAKGDVTEVLQVNPGHAVLKVTSVFFLKDGIPVEFRKAYYLGENYLFYLTRSLDL